MKRWFMLCALVLQTACNSGGKGPQAPAAEEKGTTIDGSFTCKGAGDKSWTAAFAATKVDECVVRTKDQTFDVRIGTLEDGLVLHVADFTGSGQYQVPSDSSSRVTVVAKGGVGDATSTNVDTTTKDPCAAKCTIDVAESGDAWSVDVTCDKLTRVDAGACITCTPKTTNLVRAHGIACRKE
jgi:hypothetical protein